MLIYAYQMHLYSRPTVQEVNKIHQQNTQHAAQQLTFYINISHLIFLLKHSSRSKQVTACLSVQINNNYNK